MDSSGGGLINSDWQFHVGGVTGADQVGFDDSAWTLVRLPHTAHLEPLVVNDQWQGLCWYRRTFTVPAEAAGKKAILEFAGAMSQSKLWINGELVNERMGGFLPVVVDVTAFLKPGQENVMAVQLDNRDNPLTGPKPLKRLDFNTYGGLYRNVTLTYKNPVHISHPILANKVAGGGTFITFPKVAEEKSLVQVKTHVVNESGAAQKIDVVHSIYFDGQQVAQQAATQLELAAGADVETVAVMSVADAKLWSPKAPNLYTVKTSVQVDGVVTDEKSERIGIREFKFNGGELSLNGEKIYLRGVNRHQEYPFIGYALSDNAQYRDAKKIKDAGFNYIRLSHYPQSPALMDACDELGLVALDPIMGWQYYLDDDQFRNYCYRSAAELIRRDRNRPCVLAWEFSLNETQMPSFFMAELDRIAHAEFPGENVYSAGWIDDEAYDIFLQARQHKIMHGYHENLAKPYMVSEYGDWEYYSSNAGLNQDQLDKTTRLETSSRQLRGAGEKRLLQQAFNIQEALNDNHNTSAYGDGYWVMYDYNRGYHDTIESSGISDIFRLPKFAYYFYQSQRDPSEGAMIHIASYWDENSALDLTVYSNCDEVALYRDGVLVGKQQPDSGKNCDNLKHPPFTFNMGAFTPGTLKTVGLVDGKEVAQQMITTPSKAVKLQIRLDESGRKAEAGCNDVLFAYIAAVDANGTVVPGFAETVALDVEGDAAKMNVDPIQAEAGIATALIRMGDTAKSVTLNAVSGTLTGDLCIQLD